MNEPDLQAQLKSCEQSRCALAVDALNARTAIRLLIACIEEPNKCSPDFPAYALRRAKAVLDTPIA